MMDCLDILREKWAKTFYAYAVGERGVIAKADHSSNIDEMEKASPMLSEQLLSVYAYSMLCITDIFNLRFGPDKDQVTIDEYIEATAWFFLKSPRLYRERWSHTFAAMFEAIDCNHDGVISLEEYRIFNRASRLSDEQSATVFALLDANGDGVITKDEHVDAYIRFYCDPDTTYNELPLYG